MKSQDITTACFQIGAHNRVSTSCSALPALGGRAAGVVNLSSPFQAEATGRVAAGLLTGGYESTRFKVRVVCVFAGIRN